jgi:hypothetical protein
MRECGFGFDKGRVHLHMYLAIGCVDGGIGVFGGWFCIVCYTTFITFLEHA